MYASGVLAYADTCTVSSAIEAGCMSQAADVLSSCSNNCRCTATYLQYKAGRPGLTRCCVVERKKLTGGSGMQDRFGVKFVYAWHSLAGYWAGIATGAPNEMPYNAKLIMPRPTPGAAPLHIANQFVTDPPAHMRVVCLDVWLR